MTVTRLMLGRRPKPGTTQAAFGHVRLNTDAQQAIESIIAAVVAQALARKQIAYDPDDAPQTGEVMVRPLAGTDALFQPLAPWSLERTNTAIAKAGKPATLSRAEVADGGWTFYAARAGVDGKAATIIRSTSPTRALKHGNRVITQLYGSELRPIKDPLVGIDHDADAVITDGSVYVFKPQSLERLLIDAAEVKARAPQIASKFTSGLKASVSSATGTWIEKVCSDNSNVGRRVERLNRTADLGAMNVVSLRAGLKDARLGKTAFGTAASMIEVTSADHAIALIDIAADLYWKPRFEKGSRKATSFRRL
jgi:hypothetical protein